LKETRGENEPDLLDMVEDAKASAPVGATQYQVRIPRYWKAPPIVCFRDHPEWVQNDETPLCDRCQQPMQLLFEINARIQIGCLDKQEYVLPIGDRGYAFVCKQCYEPSAGAFFWQTG
jgi:hypothetical protein